MRAQEFVAEYKKYPTADYEGVTFTMAEEDGFLTVKALNDFGISMASVIFGMDGRDLDPQSLRVDEKYRGQGIARVMYDYVKSRGFVIHRSWDQTDAGAGFWDKHRGQDERVWEQSGDKKQSVRRIQKMLNDRFDANLDIDGVLGPLTQKTINQFMPRARPGSADEPNKTTAVQGKTVKDHNVDEEQLDELSFLGSECTKDCSGHRAGYDWSKRKGLRQANSWSPSFNKGAGLAVAGK